MNINDIFKSYDEPDFLQFDKVENKRSSRRDLHAFMLLDDLFDGEADIIESSEWELVRLSISQDQIETLAPTIIQELVRCGVLYNEHSEALYIYGRGIRELYLEEDNHE